MVPADFPKELNDDQLHVICDLLNAWWNTGHILDEVMLAKVVRMHKKETKKIYVTTGPYLSFAHHAKYLQQSYKQE